MSIGNPGGAFGYTDIDRKVLPQTIEMVASAAVLKGAPVSISSTATVATTATDGTAIVGVAYEAASAAGKTFLVVVQGPASVLAGGATTNGTPVIRSATTAGYVTSSAAPVTATVVGFALGASASGRSWIWVAPGTNTSS